MYNRIIEGDALQVLREFPDASVDCCVTSPPYFGLRDYGCDGQIGQEKTPEEYIENLVEIFAEVRRCLKDTGTLWVVIGDSYVNSTKGGARYYQKTEKYKQYTNKGAMNCTTVFKASGQYKSKDMVGIPWMLAFALRANGWYLRQDIIWAKTNPMPESVRDRCTKAHEYIFLLSKSRHYYYDSAAISEPVATTTVKRLVQSKAPRYGGKKYTATPDKFYRTKSGNAYQFRANRNKRDVWTVSTKACKEAHFATFPLKLIQPCILAGCPEGGVVLDPFIGSGTTAIVAAKLGRRYIGIELNPEYVEIANRRIINEQGLFIKSI